MGHSDAAEQVALLKAAFPRTELSRETLAIYATKLADIDGQLLAAAVNRLIEDVKFFPTIAEIRKMAARLAGLLPPPAAEALAIVRRADRREKVYRRDGSVAYEERYWEWPSDVDKNTIDVCCNIIERVGDPVKDTDEDHFAWDTGFRDVYDKESEAVSSRLLADLSAARLLAGRPASAARALPAHHREPDRIGHDGVQREVERLANAIDFDKRKAELKAQAAALTPPADAQATGNANADT